ncbi:Hsp20/alpha crystallin family protein [Shimazuella sp. AN120528]|uniref:Hsp20/alpha crystallin family protein n=1 Tax=Shimazuella soli TaxID=1892854 RepID=UPI001F0D3DA0|nr:Hsp20/alpha crystallin family protein [Shimazuella soli]MCH5586672.1 Hsp20/alpha crystallin family protein [Shimazuella soli]
MRKNNASNNKNNFPYFSMDFNWLEGIINKSIDQVFSNKYDIEISPFNAPPNIKETDDYMIVQIQVPEQKKAEDIRILLDADKLKITGLSHDPIFVNLPCKGDVVGSEANYIQNTLQIRVSKYKKTNYKEIMINYSNTSYDN